MGDGRGVRALQNGQQRIAARAAYEVSSAPASTSTSTAASACAGRLPQLGRDAEDVDGVVRAGQSGDIPVTGTGRLRLQ